MTQTFDESVKKSRTLSGLSNNQLLNLYKYYKQSTVGDINTSQPWAIEVKKRAKWDAWRSLKGTTREHAMVEYTDLVNKYSH